MKKKRRAGKIIYHVLVCGVGLLMLYPLIWMLMSSFKDTNTIFSTAESLLPKPFTLENYENGWKGFAGVSFGTFFKNSLFITVVATIGTLFSSACVAYGFSRCKFKGRNLLFLLYVATMSIPWQVYMLPQYSLMNSLHLVDTHIGYILMQSFNAFGVFLMRQAFISIPDELLEAARIDGLSEYGIYGKIVLPLSKASATTLIIFTFVTIWNDYMGPMIYFNTETNKTIQLGIKMFIGQYSTEYGLVMAVSVLALIPVLLIFLIGQKQFVQGIASSGIKG